LTTAAFLKWQRGRALGLWISIIKTFKYLNLIKHSYLGLVLIFIVESNLRAKEADAEQTKLPPLIVLIHNPALYFSRSEIPL